MAAVGPLPIALTALMFQSSTGVGGSAAETALGANATPASRASMVKLASQRRAPDRCVDRVIASPPRLSGAPIGRSSISGPSPYWRPLGPIWFKLRTPPFSGVIGTLEGLMFQMPGRCAAFGEPMLVATRGTRRPVGSCQRRRIRGRPRGRGATLTDQRGTIIELDDLSHTEHAHEFVGAEHGEVPFSVILVHSGRASARSCTGIPMPRSSWSSRARPHSRSARTPSWSTAATSW